MEWESAYKELRRENAALRKQNGQLQAQIKVLEKEIKLLKQDRPNLSTPSSQIPPYKKEHRKPNGKGPGRVAGHEGACRRRPDQEDCTIEHSECTCPECGEELTQVKTCEELLEEIVPAQTQVHKHVWHEGWCEQCRQWHELRPGQVPPGVYLGTETLLRAAQLKIGYGLSYEKTCAALKDLSGLEVTPGGLAQGMQRLQRYFAGEVEAVTAAIRETTGAVNADETSLRVAGSGDWLWVFVSDLLTLVLVEEGRGKDVVERILGDGFGGVLCCDFLRSYDSLDCLKQRCLTHLLRAIKAALDRFEGCTGRRPPVLVEMKAWAQAALDLEQRKETLAASTFAKYRRELERRLDEIIAMPTANADGRRLQGRLERYRGELLTFLYEESVEGTNNRAERPIRPICVNRRMNGGHRSNKGAQSMAAIMTVLRSCAQQGRDFIATGLEIVTNYLQDRPPGVLVPDS